MLSYPGSASMVTVAVVNLEIDLHAKEPSYRQLARRLRDAIDSGELAPRDQIPSLHQLASQTGLAVATVQKAIRMLELENRVYAVSGRGTFVTPRNIDAPG